MQVNRLFSSSVRNDVPLFSALPPEAQEEERGEGSEEDREKDQNQEVPEWPFEEMALEDVEGDE